MELKKENFKELIQTGMTLIDFYATWCGPCKMMHPVIEKIEVENENLQVVKIDVDNHEDLAREYGIMSIPTIILLKDGEIVEKSIGFTPKDKIDKWLEEHQ